MAIRAINPFQGALMTLQGCRAEMETMGRWSALALVVLAHCVADFIGRDRQRTLIALRPRVSQGTD